MLLFLKKKMESKHSASCLYAIGASKVLLDSIEMAAQIQLVKKEERRRDAVKKKQSISTKRFV